MCYLMFLLFNYFAIICEWKLFQSQCFSVYTQNKGLGKKLNYGKLCNKIKYYDLDLNSITWVHHNENMFETRKKHLDILSFSVLWLILCKTQFYKNDRKHAHSHIHTCMCTHVLCFSRKLSWTYVEAYLYSPSLIKMEQRDEGAVIPDLSLSPL